MHCTSKTLQFMLLKYKPKTEFFPPQEATLSVEMTAKEELRIALEKLKKESQKECDMLAMEVSRVTFPFYFGFRSKDLQSRPGNAATSSS